MTTYWFLFLGVRNLGWAELGGPATVLWAHSCGCSLCGWLAQPWVSSNKPDNVGLAT